MYKKNQQATEIIPQLSPTTILKNSGQSWFNRENFDLGLGILMLCWAMKGNSHPYIGNFWYNKALCKANLTKK